MLFGSALALVVAFATMLGGGSDGSSEDPDAAAPVAGAPSSASTISSGPSGPPSATNRRGNTPTSPATSQTPELAEPDGPCDDADITVTPSVVGEAVAGRDVVLRLDVRTIVDEACTWQVSAGHLTVAITSGSDDIWSTQHCPAAMPVQDLVVRQDVAAGITLVWKDTRRSDEDCSRLTGWALPGFYHVAAASLGGEPVDVQFELTKPAPEVIVETTPPEGNGNGNGGTGKPGGGKPNQPDDDATEPPAATADPSGAVEPNR